MESNYFKACLSVFIGAIFFSLKAVLVKLCYNYGATAIPVLTLRMVFAMPFFLFICLQNYRFYKSLSKKIWLTVILLAFLGYYMASLFDFMGLQYITAGLERLILFVYPTIILLLQVGINKQKISVSQKVAVVLSYAGIALAISTDQNLTVQENVWLGIGLVFLGATCYAIYIFGSGNLIPKLGAKNFTSLAMLFSTIFVILHYCFSEPIVDLFQYAPPVYLLAIAMAVFSTIIPSYLISYGIKTVGAGNAGIIGSVGPISTIILAYFLLGEIFTYLQALGTALVLIGVLIISINKQQK